jgi:AhpD family alkylhydroperoxidase
MEQRFNAYSLSPDGYKALIGLEKYLAASGLEINLLHLIKLRASQLNGCAFCIDMHWKDLRAAGEGEQRLYGLDAWEESPY